MKGRVFPLCNASVKVIARAHDLGRAGSGTAAAPSDEGNDGLYSKGGCVMRRVISVVTLVSAAGLVSVLGCYRGANSGKSGTGTHQQTTVTSETVRTDTTPGAVAPVPGDSNGSSDGRVEGYPPAGGDTWGTGTPTGASTSSFDNMGAGSYGTATMAGGGGGDGGKKIAPEMGGDGGR